MASSKTVVPSLDMELLCKSHKYDDILTERVTQARELLVYILDLFDEDNIPEIWAVVGHLFLDSYAGIHSAHPAGTDWFSHNPGGEYTPDSRWFGQNLSNAIRDGEISHAIGLHAFSHTNFGKQDVSKGAAEAELQNPCPKLLTSENE
ncbi:MAG: hypothetical protein V5A45_08705 [Haloarculaceae archaeon]